MILTSNPNITCPDQLPKECPHGVDCTLDCYGCGDCASADGWCEKCDKPVFDESHHAEDLYSDNMICEECISDFCKETLEFCGWKIYNSPLSKYVKAVDAFFGDTEESLAKLTIRKGVAV